MNQLIRAHGGLVCVPLLVGTAAQCPLTLARYVLTSLTVPLACDQALHHVVHRLQLVGVVLNVPGEEGHHVVAGLGLGLGRRGQLQLAARAGDEVGGDLDLVLLGPGVDLFLHDVVGAGDPVIPEADVQFAGGAAVRMCTSGRAVAAAPSLTAVRREIFDGMEYSLSAQQTL